MLIQQILLKNFRNYEDLDIELSPGLNILYGDNAQGKTSFVEAAYVCSTGRSQRTSNIRELIMISKPDSHICAIISGDEQNPKNLPEQARQVKYDRIDVHLRRDDSKGIALNGLAIKKIGDLFGTLLTVIFSPEDLGLIKSGPGERRRFMDMELCQLSAVYYNELRQYYQVLKQRNNLLKNAKSNKAALESVFVWDEQLISYGIRIMKARAEFIEEMGAAAGAVHGDISQTEQLKLVYKPCAAPEEFAERLKKSLDRDLATGTTNIGVHRDDVLFTINGSDARYYGSQGQQRTACLSLKLAEIGLVCERKHNKPVLLLDDVMSELDDLRQRYLLKRALNVQTVITFAGSIKEDIMRKAGAVFKVKNGMLFVEK